jgi:REP element-mobilizing transposase RayT
MPRPKQLTLARTAGWGGKRKGAGRRPIPGRRRPVVHRARPAHKGAHPVHLTLRARSGLPSLRAQSVSPVIREAMRAASSTDFRILHFSVQSDHLHLMVEATDAHSLGRGARGLVIRLARAVNRALHRRGSVWGDRYHTRVLKTPREVRNGFLYVLMNFRKHRPWDRRAFDPCSSAAWFDGFKGRYRRPEGSPPICAPRTWLAGVGWRRHGLLDPLEAPST